MDPEPITIKVRGTLFRCNCGSQLFHSEPNRQLSCYGCAGLFQRY